MNRPLSLVLASFLLICTACGSASDSTKELTDENNGETVQLKVNDTMEVALPSNPSTGYQWQVSSIDTAVLRADGEPEFIPDSDAVGSGGLSVFHFRALAAGTSPLQLDYLRTWEIGVPPAQTFTVNVEVE